MRVLFFWSEVAVKTILTYLVRQLNGRAWLDELYRNHGQLVVTICFTWNIKQESNLGN
jgi:hypothetical protein